MEDMDNLQASVAKGRLLAVEVKDAQIEALFDQFVVASSG
jgi:hypothetical protein